MSSFVEELRRRHVVRVATAYAVTSWLILQSVDVVFPILGLDEALGRPILAILLVGFPIALVLTWYFEITPEGIKRDRQVRESSLPRPTGRTLDRIIIVVLVFAVGLLLFDKLVLQKPARQAPAAQLTSIAVLPFVNGSGQAENEYFSDGLTETLMYMLSQLPELRVAARTSVFSFKDRDEDVREIARQLDVAAVLLGSVQRSGSAVRIFAQLVEAQSGTTLWSANFDHDVDDIFAVQDEIARNVANALQRTLLAAVAGDESIQGLTTSNPLAYEKYLLGLEQKNIASYASLPLAEGLFEEALSLDPGFVEATVELASSYLLQGETGMLDPRQVQDRVLPLLEPVLEADRDNGRAFGLLATLEWQAAVQAFGPAGRPTQLTERALRYANELAPNDTDIYSALATAASAASRHAEALVWIDRGLKVDPLSARLHLMRGRVLLGPLDRPADAAAAFAEGRKAAPRWSAVTLASGDAEFAQNRFAEGFGWYLRAIELDPQDHELPAVTAERYYDLGLDGAGDDMLRRARALAPREARKEARTSGVELGRLLRTRDHERAAVLAEQMLRDDVENRGEAFDAAAIGYASSMLALGRPQAVVDLFESIRPGIGVPGGRLRGAKESRMQFVLVQVFKATGALEQAAVLLEDLTALADETAPGWRDDPYTMANVALAGDDGEAALAYALEDLGRPLGRQMDWRRKYRDVVWLEPLLTQPRIAARLQELDAETDAARDEVRAMLAERSASLSAR